MSNVKITLAVGIALTIGVAALVLTGAPPRVARANGVTPTASLGVTQSELTICQPKETVPAGASAVRVSIVAFFGSQLTVVAYHEGQVLTSGHRNPDWSGASATVPIKPVDRTTSNVKVCVAFVPNSELLQIFGERARPQNTAVAFRSNESNAGIPGEEGTALNGRIMIQYLAPGRSSWWSSVATVATHMGLGHFIGGKSVALLALALMAAVGALTVRVALREQP
jgi:hypothetical protein